MNLAVIENLSAASLPVARELFARGYAIRYFRTDGPAAAEWVRQQKLRVVSWRELPGGDDPYLACPHERWAQQWCQRYFDRYYRGHYLLKLLRDFFRDDAVDLIIKRIILQDLAEYAIISDYLARQINNQRDDVVLVSEKHHRYGRNLARLGAGSAPPARVTYREIRPERWRETWLHFTRFSYLVLKGLAGVFRRVGANQKKTKYLVGIRCYRSDLGSVDNAIRDFDFLIDGRKLTADNVLFCLETDVGENYWRKLKERGYRVWVMHRQRKLVLSLRTLGYLLVFQFSGLLAPTMLYRLALTLMLTRVRWETFTRRFGLTHYVVMNDMSPEHVARNLTLRQQGIQTWFFAHSFQSINVFDMIGAENPVVHHLFASYVYDHFVDYGHATTDYYQRQETGIGQFHELGCYFSELIPRVSREPGTPPRIMFFDTSWGFEDPYSCAAFMDERDYTEFMTGLERLASNGRGYRVGYKAKYGPDGWQAAWPEQHRLYQRLRAEGRIHFHPAEISTLALIGQSDLVISMAFSSTTNETIGAGIRAMFYDPCGKYRGTFYDRCPKLVAHNYEQLEEYADYWLALSEDEYREYGQRYFHPEIDSYCDGRGLTRFRDLLVGTVEASKGGDKGC